MKMSLDTLDNVDHKYVLYKKLGENHARKRYQPRISVVHKGHTTKSTLHSICKGGHPNALSLATSTRSVVNHQHDQIHKYNSSTLLGIADKVWFFISYQRLSPEKCKNRQQLGLCHRGKRGWIRLESHLDIIKHLFSNAVKIMLFISDAHYYLPVK